MKRALPIVLVVLSLAGVALWLVTTTELLGHDVLGRMEGVCLNSGLTMLHGQPLYPPHDQPPFSPYSYGPLHPLVSAGFLALLGHGLTAVRWVTVLAELASALLIYAHARELGRRELAVLLAALFLAATSFHRFHVLARVDPLYIALCLTVSWAWLRHRATGRARHLAVLALLPAMALATKISAVTMLAPIGLASLWDLRDPARRARALEAAIALVVSVALYGLLFLLLQRRTDGEFFYQQLAMQVASGMSLARALGVMAGFVLAFAVLLLAGGGAAIAHRGELSAFVRLQLGAAIVAGALMAGKEGADHNYFLPALAWAVIALGTVTTPWRVAAIAMLAVLNLCLFRRQVDDFLQVQIFARDPRDRLGTAAYFNTCESTLDPARQVSLISPEARRERAHLLDLARQAPGPVLGEDPVFAIAHGDPVWLGDSYVMRVLFAARLADVRLLVKDLGRGAWQRVFEGKELASTALHDVLVTYYQPVYRSRTPFTDTYITVWDRRQGPPRPGLRPPTALPAEPAAGRLTLRVRAVDAASVVVAGDWNDWSLCRDRLTAEADGAWRITLDLPPGPHAYKFVINDRRWYADPGNPPPPGGKNSIAVVP